ncbi:uncharacterized protein LOC141683527 [Apium graveolens]|uniref:uncharacterized protein LOC141683527 n=1 Tax=Apium graveolens TaxID=4045 RepID=UPI003D7A7949
MNSESERRKKKARLKIELDHEYEDDYEGEDDRYQGEDRLSTLPDELLHRILKFVDTKLSVSTSALSKRWKPVWTTLPFLKFEWDQRFSAANTSNLARHVLKHRNHESQISRLEMTLLPAGLIAKFVDYAILHRVKCLNVQFRTDHKPFSLSIFNSSTIRELELHMKADDDMSEFNCWNLWDLPALSTLRLIRLTGYFYYESQGIELSVQNFTCLPSLRNLLLESWDLLSSAFSLPELTTLVLRKCKLPTNVWNLPALKTLTLDDISFRDNMKEYFTALVNLQNLKLIYNSGYIHACSIHCPKLVNLEIETRYNEYKGIPDSTIVVFAPELSTFTSVGIFPITFEDSKLDIVNVKLRGWIDDKNFSREKLKECYQQFTVMLPKLGSAKILYLDLETIEALLSIFDFLLGFPSPFYDLKYVKLPCGCNEGSISSTLKSYLLGGSPTATIVAALPQNTTPYTVVATVKAPNVVLREPLGVSTKVLVNCQHIHRTVSVDTADTGMQEEPVGQDSLSDVDRVRQIRSPVERTGNDRVSFAGGNSEFGLWRGHEVNCEFVCLLDLIMDKYPETFEHFTTKNKKFCSVKLNTLCTLVNDFTRISMTDVDAEMIAEYRDAFAELQKFGFNVSWLVSRLIYIEQVRFSRPLLSELHEIDSHIADAKSKLQEFQVHIDDTKTKLRDLETLRAEKMQEIQIASGTMVTNLVVGYIGDDLFSSP